MQKHDYINTPEADDIRENFKSAELNRLRLAAGSITFWSYVGVLLSAVFLLINSAQAYWALNHLAGLATDSPINAVVTGLIAVSLILAANVVSIRLGAGMSKGTGITILLGLMIFSIITSSLHLGFQVLGGYQSSISGSTEYKMALADYELAAKAYTEVLDSAAKADEEGDTRSGGWIRKSYAPPLRDDVDSARTRLEATKQTAGTEASVLAQVAGFFNMSPERFSTLFALFSVLLMEISRIWLAFSTASAVRQLIQGKPEGKKFQPELRAVA